MKRLDRRSSAANRGYDATWRRLRRMVLADEPLCRICKENGDVTPARVVDHIVPISKRPDLRLERSNLQSLCDRCHNATKKADDLRGYSKRVGSDGLPVDKRHPFWRGASR